MTINENNEEIFRIFNTPKNLNLSELFPTYTEDRLDKVRYIIHQCNYYSSKYGYNLHTMNHAWFLSLTPNEVGFIIETLVENKIIKLSVKGAKGKQSNHYKIVTPYNYHKEDTVNKHIFNINDVNCPLWYQRYVADGGVRNKETTNWVKRPADWQPEIKAVLIEDKDQLIASLQAEVAALKELIASHGIDMTSGHGKQFESTMAIVSTEPEPEETPEAIFIRKGEKEGIITNYYVMAEWYETLSNEDRATIESYLLNGTGTSISYTIRKDYNVYFKREENDGMVLITFKKVVKDFIDIIAA